MHVSSCSSQRGQGSSEGVFQGFGQESADTATTLTWLHERPECNGRIGLYGLSYQGLTQLLAPEDCPVPDCLAPAMCGVAEREHRRCEGGAHWWHPGLRWGLQLAALQAKRPRCACHGYPGRAGADAARVAGNTGGVLRHLRTGTPPTPSQSVTRRYSEAGLPVMLTGRTHGRLMPAFPSGASSCRGLVGAVRG